MNYDVTQSCLTLCDPWTIAHQASLSITNSQSLPKFMSIESVMHPLSSPSPPAPNLSQHQSLFQWVNSSREVAKVLEFQLQHHSHYCLRNYKFLSPLMIIWKPPCFKDYYESQIQLTGDLSSPWVLNWVSIPSFNYMLHWMWLSLHTIFPRYFCS